MYKTCFCRLIHIPEYQVYTLKYSTLILDAFLDSLMFDVVGTDWGMDGYMLMIRNKNMCGIATDATYPY